MATKHSLASDFLHEFTCTPCSKENVNIEAAWFCVECNEHYCDQCLKAHNRLGALIGHQVLKEEALRQFNTSINTYAGPSLPTDKCRRHFNKLLDMYCEDDDVVGCSTCVALEHRLCEIVLYIPDIADDRLKGINVQAVTCELTKTLDEIKHLKQDRLDHRNRLADERDSGLNCVEMRRGDINEYLDSLDVTVKKRVTDKHNEFSSKLADDVNTFDEAIALLQDMNSRLQTPCNPSQSFVNIKRTEQTVKDIENVKQKCLQSNNDSLTISNESNECVTITLEDGTVKLFGEQNGVNMSDPSDEVCYLYELINQPQNLV